MATALKSTPTRSALRQRSPQSRQRSHLKAVLPPAKVSQIRQAPMGVTASNSGLRWDQPSKVRKLPARRPLPTWLRLLIYLQRGSVIVTFVLVTAALVVYGSTIYMQQHWSKGYNKLKSMQRSERQMIAAEGLIKNQLIQQADSPGSGLVPRTSAHTIVLEPAPDRLPVTPNLVQPTKSASSAAPLGY